MGDVVSLRPAKDRTDLFERWRLATLKAQQTLDFDDAMAAGRAWREWLESFQAIAK